MRMKIESIRLKNFKAFKDVEMRDIPRFCIIVGANGTGKSSLFSAACSSSSKTPSRPM